MALIWRYFAHFCQDELREDPLCLCRKIVRWSGKDLSLGQMLTCLDIFSDVGLLETHRINNYITVRLPQVTEKRDLNESRTMQQLKAAKEQ